MTQQSIIDLYPTLELSATYSPEDNKLRLYANEWLEKDLYDRLKNAGFRSAPKQNLIFAPMWTPSRADLLMELTGFIGDEETTLEERAEQRAKRFEGYQANRTKDAEQALNEYENLKGDSNVITSSDNWRHQRKAQKKADKIERLGQRVIDMWETSEYWEYRITGVLAHANGRNNIRTLLNRIKKLTAGKRKQEKYIKEYQFIIEAWSKKGLTQDRAVTIINHLDRSIKISSDLEDGKATPQEAMNRSIARNKYKIDYANRWLNHYENRLTYENAILKASGYVEQEKAKRPPQPKLLNYRISEGLQILPRGYCPDNKTKTWNQVEMTKAEYKNIYHDWKGTKLINNDHRVRVAIIYDPSDTKKSGYGRKLLDVCVFITDSKEHKKPC